MSVHANTTTAVVRHHLPGTESNASDRRSFKRSTAAPGSTASRTCSHCALDMKKLVGVRPAVRAADRGDRGRRGPHPSRACRFFRAPLEGLRGNERHFDPVPLDQHARRQPRSQLPLADAERARRRPRPGATPSSPSSPARPRASPTPSTTGKRRRRRRLPAPVFTGEQRRTDDNVTAGRATHRPGRVRAPVRSRCVRSRRA